MSADFQRIDRDLLVAHPSNPREDLGDRDLDQLADSIRKYGILQPLLVASDGQRYRVLAGHRRLAAAVMVGLADVPCIVRDASNDAPLAVMLAENLQRRDLNPIEEAQAIQALANQLGVQPRDLTNHIHKHVDYIWQSLLLLELSPEEQEAVATGRLKLTKARQLAKQYRAERNDSSMPGRRSTEWTDEDRRKTNTAHFGHDHPLAGAAQAICIAQNHSDKTWLARTATVEGTACARCWEATIRADERERTVAQIEIEADVEATRPSVTEARRVS